MSGFSHPALRWRQTSPRCLQTKGTCWSVAGWWRSKVKGKWQPTSWTMGHPTVSSHGNSRCWDDPHCKDTASLSEDSQCEQMAEKQEAPSLESPSKEEKTFRTSEGKSVLDERRMLPFDSHFGPNTYWRTSVFLMSSLSLRLLERCKVCLFKTTPFSLCQEKTNAVHKATFYFTFFFFWWFLIHMNYEEVLMFYFWIIYFNVDVLCKRSFMKKCEYIQYVHKYPVYYTFIRVYVHAYLCVYGSMYKTRRNILTKD